MRLISIDEYNELLMQLARPVYDRHRRVLLAEGRTIHPTYLQKLKAMDIRYIFVEDAESRGITMEEMVNVPTWIDAIKVIQDAFEAVRKGEEIPMRELQRLVVKLVEEVAKRKALILIPASSQAEELAPYAHAVNVALLSMQIAKKKNINQLQLKDLAIGALLHDIGKVLTDREVDHPKVGFEYMRKVREISLLASHVAYQHHEWVNGEGKPRKLFGEQIHEFAQICSISNVYEHMISEEHLPPHEAMEYIMVNSGKMFSPELVQLFVQEVPPYIPGTKVTLNNDRNAIVTKIKSNIQRPFIRYLDSGEELSLADHHTLLISKVLH
jgi:putative nucleotidyltransferase with HDIG domain